MGTSEQVEETAAPLRYEVLLPAVPASVPEIRTALTDWVAALELERRQVDAVRLAVTEAATNAVVHAFVDREPGTIQVLAEPVDDALVVRVIDDGRGLGPRHDSPGMGMGLPLIGKLAAHVDLRDGLEGGGTEVRMTFAVPGLRGPGSTPAGGLEDVFADLARLGTGEAFAGADVGMLAQLLVPRLCDVCTVTLLDADGVPQRIGAAVAGADGVLDPEAERWVLDFPPTKPDAPSQRAAQSGDVQVVDVTRPWIDAVSPDDRRAGLLEALDLEWWAAVPLKTGDQPVGSVSVASRASRGDAGPVIAATEQIVAQASGLVAAARLVDELRRTRRRFEGILGAIAEAVTVSAGQDGVVYANQAAADLLGVARPEDVLGRPSGDVASLFDITDEDGRPVSYDELPHEVVLRGAEEHSLVTRSVHRPSGRVRWLRTTARRLDESPPLSVNIIQDLTAEKEALIRQRFLADVGETLVASRSTPELFAAIARTVVPALADWCAVDVVDGDKVERVALEHVDPAKVELGWKIWRGWDGRTDPGVEQVLRSGEPLVLPRVTPEVLEVGVDDPEQLERLRAIGFRSVALLPVAARGRTFGVLTLVTAESLRTFSDADVELAADVARRAALAIDAREPAAG